MNQVVSMIIFVMLLNATSGLLIDMMPEVFAQPLYNSYQSSSGYQSDFNQSLSGTINPTGDLEDRSDAFDRLLDKLSLGFYNRVKTFINKYMFGFVTILEKVFGDAFHPAFAYLIKSIITVGYTFTVIWIFTNKSFNR